MLPRSSTHCLRMAVTVLAKHLKYRSSWLLAVPRSTAGEIQHRSVFYDGRNTSPLLARMFSPQNNITRQMSPIVEENVGTHKPSAFQKKILVWGKMYQSVDKVPDRVTRNQLTVAMDKFRIRVCIIMMAVTLIASIIYAVIGRKERDEGKTITKIALSRKQN